MNEKDMQRSELQLHTTASAEISVLTPREIIEEAVKRGMKAVAITDRNSVQCFYSMEWLVQKYEKDIKVIYGVELPRTSGDNVTVLVKDQAGLKPLYKLVSGKVISEEERKHLLFGAHDPSNLHQAVQDGSGAETLFQLASEYDYIELRVKGNSPQDCELNRQLYALGKKLGKPVVAVGNCKYLHTGHMICTDIIEFVRYGSTDVRELHLRTTEEMLEYYAYLGEEAAFEVVVTAPNQIADSIDQVYPSKGNRTAFSLPNADETVRQICEERLQAIYGEQPLLRDRLEQELACLGSKASLFLLSHKVAEHLNEKGALTGMRGTVGSCLIAYLLGISAVNPLPAHYRCQDCKHIEFAEAESGYDLPKKSCPHCGKTMIRDGQNIPFETCMGTGDGFYADMSLNMSNDMRVEAKRFLSELIGKERLAAAGITGNFAQKTAIGYVRAYSEKMQSNFDEVVIKWLANKITGVKRCDGYRPGGVVILPEGMEWEDVTPVRPHDDEVCGVVTHMEYYSLEELLPKIDLLSFSNYARLQELFEVTGAKPEDIDYHDQKVLDLFRNVSTGGVPCFSDKFTQNLLGKLETISFSDLVKVCSMAHSTNAWNENGEYLLQEHPFKTLIGNRDDVFLTLRKYGVDRHIACKAMKYTRMGKMQHDMASVNELIERMQQADVPEWYIDSMKKVHYLVPKAHAAHYAKLGYMIAWFKIYYPDAFYQVSMKHLDTEQYMSYNQYELTDLLKDLDVIDYREWEVITFLIDARQNGYI